jgi:hypothetical protein
MMHILGKITKRILSGEIPADSIHPTRSQPQPKPSSVRGAKGQGLGKGATRKRNGGE